MKLKHKTIVDNKRAYSRKGKHKNKGGQYE